MTNQQGAPEAPSYEHQRAIMEGERNASLAAFNYDARLSRDGERLYETGFTNGWNRLAALVEAQQPAPSAAADPQLLKFYGVTTDAELIAAQARHIERLQAKLPQNQSFAPQRVREG